MHNYFLKILLNQNFLISIELFVIELKNKYKTFKFIIATINKKLL